MAEGIEDRQEGLDVGFVYSEALEKFSADIPDDSIDEVRDNPNVDYVERDKVMRATQASSQQLLPWGVERSGADNSLTPLGDPNDGFVTVTGVNVYVIDSGLNKRNEDLNITLEDHVNMLNDGKNRDCYGHRTHVAGTLAAVDDTDTVVGVAPGASLTGVKVLDCKGNGTLESVIAGVEWVTENADKPAVANMSLSGPKGRALDEAVRDSADGSDQDGGVLYSVSAGNGGINPCGKKKSRQRSPARAGLGTNGIITVAATNRSDEETAFSNYGPCVDLWAPGKNILSTWLGGATEVHSGTSMAAPHVGGAAALYRSNHPDATPTEVEAALKRQAERPTPTSTKSKNGTLIALVDAEKASQPSAP